MPTFLGRRVPTSAIVGQAPRPYTAAPAPSMRTAQAAPMGDLSKAIAGLGANFANGTQRALQQEQLTKLTDQNELVRMYANAVGTDGMITDPRAFSITSGLGVSDPSKLARANAVVGHGRDGPGSTMGTNALYALGEGNKTQKFFDESFANEIAKQGMQEATKLRMVDAQEAANTRRADMALETVMTPEGPRMVRRSAAVGQAPLVSADQNKAIVQNELLPTLPLDRKTDFAFGAQSPGDLGNVSVGGVTMPAFVRPDGYYAPGGGKIEGKVDSFGKLTATTADGLSGDSGVGKDVLAGRINTERAVGLIDGLQTELDKPNSGVSVGFLGSLSEVANNIRSQVESGAKALGGLSARDELRGADPQAREVAGTVDRVMQENSARFAALQQQGIDTARIRALIEDLAYAQAKANDPSGRVSNQDVERAGRQVGMGLGDPVAMKEVLKELRERTITGQEIRERNSSAFLKSGQSLPTWNSPIMQGRPGRAAPPAGAPAPGGATTPPAGTRLRFDENGNPR